MFEKIKWFIQDNGPILAIAIVASIIGGIITVGTLTGSLEAGHGGRQ